MKSYFKKLSVNWLSSEVNQTTNFDTEKSEEYIEYELDSRGGWLRGTMLKPSRSICIYRGQQYFDTEIVGTSHALSAYQVAFEENTFMAQVVDKGSITQRESLKKDLVTKPNLASFRHCRNIKAQSTYEAGTLFTEATMAISLPVLDTLIGKENREKLFEIIDIEQVATRNSFIVNAHIRNILLQSHNPKLQGNIKLLYAESKALEFISLLQEFIFKSSENRVSRRQHLKIVYDLHEYLCNLNGVVPSLETLAQEFGMSSRNLNRIFSSEFGISIYKFIVKHRLKEAHKIIENTNIPQKQIASNLGYSHVNNFITAFKKEFNYPPGSLRK